MSTLPEMSDERIEKAWRATKDRLFGQSAKRIAFALARAILSEGTASLQAERDALMAENERLRAELRDLRARIGPGLHGGQP